MSEFYTMKIAGLDRKLEKFPVSDKLDIAAFILFGDVEITVHSAEKLLERIPEFDFIVTPEAKSIPLAYEMARQSGKPYIVVRKHPKLFMKWRVKAVNRISLFAKVLRFICVILWVLLLEVSPPIRNSICTLANPKLK